MIFLIFLISSSFASTFFLQKTNHFRFYNTTIILLFVIFLYYSFFYSHILDNNFSSVRTRYLTCPALRSSQEELNSQNNNNAFKGSCLPEDKIYLHNSYNCFSILCFIKNIIIIWLKLILDQNDWEISLTIWYKFAFYLFF